MRDLLHAYTRDLEQGAHRLAQQEQVKKEQAHLKGLQTTSAPYDVEPTSRLVLDIARLDMSEASGQGGSQDAAADGCELVHCHTSTLPLVPVPC